MRMRENLMDIYKVLINDEILLRLLYYKPSDMNDDPLSLDKPNILDKPDVERWEIINNVIKRTEKTTDQDQTEKCRVLIYPGKRRGDGRNYMVSEQDVFIDVLVPIYYDEVDFRLSWICDRINELLFDKEITGLNKIKFNGGGLKNAPNGFIGYTLVYKFSTTN